MFKNSPLQIFLMKGEISFRDKYSLFLSQAIEMLASFTVQAVCK